MAIVVPAILALLAQSPAPDRYAKVDPVTLTVPQKPVLRKDYVDAVRRNVRDGNGRDEGLYGPRHALPALSVAVFDGNKDLGPGILKTLRFYDAALDKQIAKDRGTYSFEGAYLCAIHFRELRTMGLMTPDDEAFAKKLLLKLREFQYAWNPGDGLWRGVHHRAQAQGVNHLLAAKYFPQERDAKKWKAYGETVWKDWWDYRDIGINDINYFFSSFQRILCAAELLDRREIFTDKLVRKFLWERFVQETPPDGAVVPYGAHGGYHSMAGTKIFALEAAARATRDGRYKWAAQRAMNFGQARGFSNGHGHYEGLSIEDIALAGLVCDDTVAPARPEPGSAVLPRKEVVLIGGDEFLRRFPEAGGVDCSMVMTQREIPSKLVLRSGWDPGDLFMLVECFTRHGPLNPTAVYALERWSSSFAEMQYEKFISRENALRIEDLDGKAVFCGEAGASSKGLVNGYAGMEATVPVFHDNPRGTHAVVNVTHYMGYEATQQREILFAKNALVLMRDTTAFEDGFKARVGPVWNAQRVGTPRGDTWMNTWMEAHFFQGVRLYENPPWDLLIYHVPQTGAKLVVPPSHEAMQGSGTLHATQFAWEGDVQRGTKLRFVTLLLPHEPVRDATSLAAGIRVLVNDRGRVALGIERGTGYEVAGFSDGGAAVDLTLQVGGAEHKFSTNAPAFYLEIRDGAAVRAYGSAGKPVRLDGSDATRK